MKLYQLHGKDPDGTPWSQVPAYEDKATAERAAASHRLAGADAWVTPIEDPYWPPPDLPAERFDVVTPIGRDGPYSLHEASWMRDCCMERLGMKEAEVQVVPHAAGPIARPHLVRES